MNRPGLRLILSLQALVWLVSAVTLSAIGRSAEAPAAAGPPEVTLYLGLEFSLEHQGAPCPVVGIESDAVEIRDRDGQVVKVAGQMDRVKSTPILRVGRTSVAITDVKPAQADSTYRLRQIEAMRQQVTMDDIQQGNRERAEVALHAAEGRLASSSDGSGQPGPGSPPDAQARIEAAANAVDAAGASPVGDQHINRGPVGSGGYDTFQLTFKIAAPMEIARPRGVVRLFFRSPAAPAQTLAVARFFEIRKVRAKPTRVSVSIARLPRGFEVVGYSLDVYDGGTELLTSLSKDQVRVSIDEAHQVLIQYHTQKNTKASVPMAIVRELLPEGLGALVPAAWRDGPVDVVVDQHGRVARLAIAAGSSAQLNARLDAALRAVRFLPALQNGEPITSEGRFALFEFVP